MTCTCIDEAVILCDGQVHCHISDDNEFLSAGSIGLVIVIVVDDRANQGQLASRPHGPSGTRVLECIYLRGK